MRSTFVVFSMIVILTICGCGSKEERARKTRTEVETTKSENFIKEVMYVKDERTNTCFALSDQGLATVECRRIPTEMLNVPTIPKK